MAGIAFLDLDGTLTDPKPGITGSVQFALRELGLPVPSADELEWVIGPPLLHSFETLGAPDPDRALALYRRRYSAGGLFENQIYGGIPETLQTLRDAGVSMCLATAKPIAYARRITAHFGLSRFLDHQFGPDLDGRHSIKAELLAHALTVTGARAGSCVMIGDRHHDYDAARAVGMPSVAVTWGYGSAAERAGASRVCDSTGALAATILDSLGITAA